MSAASLITRNVKDFPKQSSCTPTGRILGETIIHSTWREAPYRGVLFLCVKIFEQEDHAKRNERVRKPGNGKHRIPVPRRMRSTLWRRYPERTSPSDGRIFCSGCPCADIRPQEPRHADCGPTVLCGGHWAQLQAETEAEKNQERPAGLSGVHEVPPGSLRTVQGVERPENSPSRSMAVLYHRRLQGHHPAEEMVDPPEDLHGLPKSEVLFSMVNRRMGAEVDYVVKGVDQESGLAAASRLEAMAIKRREYYTGAGRDGNNLLYEGVCAEARWWRCPGRRLCGALRCGDFHPPPGAELPADAGRHCCSPAGAAGGGEVAGDSPRRPGTTSGWQSQWKQASANPYEKALRPVFRGQPLCGDGQHGGHHRRLCGLGRGRDCLCSYPPRGRPPQGAQVTVRILGKSITKQTVSGA